MSKLNVLFTSHAFEDYMFWQSTDKKQIKRINELIKSIQRDGQLDGIGKPEKLKGNLSGFSSRRIDREHRLVYRVENEQIEVISCRYHYA
ncbi:Txe/YoeB family addiction module toxin [Listeria sp. FSL L7-0091]|uniref:Txe/YoeB family addiction module toxin n=1 Tax=Listeria farberi TaxID=2713500 RepID=UPI0016273468|nr:Txe/YoeB family addiction module toxin [Listeria farberi]MBC2262514.1 Txe/YoeB family addiction module toxin [Listeria farberi]